jgi:hypothetical protein
LCLTVLSLSPGPQELLLAFQVEAAEALFFVSTSSPSIQKPETVAVIKAAKGRSNVISGSNKAYVTAIESTPVSGVDIRKAAVAPLLAPCRRKLAAAGTTPQLHKGMGTPRAEALMMLENFPLPRCLATKSSERKAFNSPATKKPKSINTADSWRICQDSVIIFKIISIFVPNFKALTL